MMHDFPSRRPVAAPTTADRRRRSRIDLPMILALMVIGSLAVVALLTFATTLFINRPPIEVRDRTFWSAKSAMSMAMVVQNGTSVLTAATSRPMRSPSTVSTANVTCTPVSVSSPTRRAGSP